jgi:hypothetical protein
MAIPEHRRLDIGAIDPVEGSGGKGRGCGKQGTDKGKAAHGIDPSGKIGSGENKKSEGGWL